MYTTRYSSSYGSRDTPSGKVLAVMERIQGSYKQKELHLLVFLVDMCHRNFEDSYARTRLPQLTNDDNLNNTIYQKLMQIKARNYDNKIKLLNLQATLAKQCCNNRKVTYEKKYQETMDRIREKAFTIREKLDALKKSRIPNRKVLHHDSDRGQKAVNELMQVTQTLSHEALKLRTEFATLRDMFPEFESG